MKKIIILISLLLISCFSLIACSTDFSETINESSNQIYDSIRDYAEPFLKEDPSFSEGNEQKPEENPTTSEEGSNEN